MIKTLERCVERKALEVNMEQKKIIKCRRRVGDRRRWRRNGNKKKIKEVKTINTWGT